MADELTEGQKQEAIKREMRRKSLDECRIYNPSSSVFENLHPLIKYIPPSENYNLIYDNFPHLIVANSEAIFVRYIVERYLTEMIDKILTYNSDKQVKTENERRLKKGMALMDKHTEQPAFESKFAINQPELRKVILSKLWGGVVKEYGKDMPLENRREITTSTSDADLLAEIEAEQVVSELALEEPATLADEVTNDKE